MDVIIDHNRRTAIIVGRGRKYTSIVPMEEGELVIRKLSQEQLDARGFRPLDYPVKRAVRKFMKHNGGVSKVARDALRAVAI